MSRSCHDIPPYQRHRQTPGKWFMKPFTRNEDGTIDGGEFSVRGVFISEVKDRRMWLHDGSSLRHHFILSEGKIGDHFKLDWTTEGGMCATIYCKSHGYYHQFHLMQDVDIEIDSLILAKLKKAGEDGRMVDIRGKAFYYESVDPLINQRMFRGFNGSTSCPVVEVTGITLYPTRMEKLKRELAGMFG